MNATVQIDREIKYVETLSEAAHRLVDRVSENIDQDRQTLIQSGFDLKLVETIGTEPVAVFSNVSDYLDLIKNVKHDYIVVNSAACVELQALADRSLKGWHFVTEYKSTRLLNGCMGNLIGRGRPPAQIPVFTDAFAHADIRWVKVPIALYRFEA